MSWINDFNKTDWGILIIIVLAGLGATYYSVHQHIQGVKDRNQATKDSIAAKAEAVANSNVATLRHNESKADNDSLKSSLQITEEKLLKKEADAAIELAKVYKDLAEANEKLYKGQEETMKRVIGDGHAEIGLEYIDNNTFGIQIISKTKYPLYDTQLLFYDYNEIIKCPIREKDNNFYIKEDCLKPHTQAFNQTFNILPYRTLNIKQYKLPIPAEGTRKYILFRLGHRNTITFQYSIIWIDTSKKRLYHSYKIYEYSHGKYELLNDEYEIELPLSEWENNFHFLKDLKTDNHTAN